MHDSSSQILYYQLFQLLREGISPPAASFLRIHGLVDVCAAELLDKHRQ